MKSGYDLVVIGGGPAGFFGALSAAEANPGLRIMIAEKGSKLLRKVRISGGGRCNVTHACFDPAELVTYYPRGNKELRGPFSRFQPADTVKWFAAHGVEIKTESDGRMFPISNTSETIVNCLLDESRKLGIAIRTRTGVTGLSSAGGGYTLTLNNGDSLQTNAVLIAAGGGADGAYQLIQNLGHTIHTPVPSLFTFKLTDPRLEGLAGVSVPDARLSISRPQIETGGPLLITHWGLSGPAALKLSAWGARALAEDNYHSRLMINWLPAHTTDSALALLKKIRIDTPRQQVTAHPPKGMLPTRLWQRLCAHAGIPAPQPWIGTSNQALANLASELTQGEFQIQGKGVYKDEFVTCGGVTLKEVDFRTMESRIAPGVYFAGEVLDIDGLTGGFNFQSAWTTGWLAGQAVAAR